MGLVYNAKKITTGSWSMRLWYLAGFLNAIGLAWPLIERHVEAVASPFWFHIAGLVAGLAGQVARVIYQQDLRE